MTNFTTDSAKLADLSFEEQAIVALIEILDRVALGKDTLARVDRVILDLYGILPWTLDKKDTNSIIDRVAQYGINELPGYDPDADDE